MICPLSNRNNDLRGTYDDARRGALFPQQQGFRTLPKMKKAGRRYESV